VQQGSLGECGGCGDRGAPAGGVIFQGGEPGRRGVASGGGALGGGGGGGGGLLGRLQEAFPHQRRRGERLSETPAAAKDAAAMGLVAFRC
jgi:hypothetical protein